MKRVRAICMAIMLIAATLGTTLTVSAAPKTDKTLAVPPVFAQSQYAVLNPTVAQACNNDINLMYQHYMAEGVKKGERLFATPTITPLESLFLYMSNNRQTYVKNGLNADFKYFNLANYMSQNPALKAVYGDNKTLWLYDYINFGIYAGRSCGTNTDPAKVILWNNSVAGFNNAKMTPEGILNNYKLVTGQGTTELLLVPVKTATPKPATTLTYTSSSSKSHEHNWKYESIDDKKHKKECKDCDESIKEDHHYHVYSQTNGSDTSKHVLKCSKCDHKYAESHYDRNNDGKCDKCGYTLTHTHNFVSQTSGQTATQHVEKCSTCNATRMVNHTPSYEYNGGTSNTHKVKCNVCGGYIMNPAEACDTSGTGGSCSKCGHLNGVIPAHTHTYGAWESLNNGTHRHSCTDPACPGGEGATETASCDHDGVGGKCSVCGYEWAAPAHTHTYGDWESLNNGTHRHSCTSPTCPGGADAVETADCDHDGAGGKCSVCGYEWPAPAHTHTYANSWTSDGAGHHYRYCTDDSCPDHEGSKEIESCDSAEGGACSKCGYDPTI